MASRREKAPRSGKCTPQGAGPGQRPGALRRATGSRGSAPGLVSVIELFTVNQRQNSYQPSTWYASLGTMQSMY